MINAKRVKKETRLAIYDAHGAAEDDKINSCYKSDYVIGKMLGTFLCGTIAYGIILAGLGFYNFEDLMLNIYNSSLAAMAFTFIVGYVVFMAVLLVLTFLIYSYRYNRSAERLEAYYDVLRDLAADYKAEEEL